MCLGRIRSSCQAGSRYRPDVPAPIGKLEGPAQHILIAGHLSGPQRDLLVARIRGVPPRRVSIGTERVLRRLALLGDEGEPTQLGRAVASYVILR